MDFDGDIFFLCNDPIVVDSKIDKHIILDIEDKATAISKPYTKENIIEYEIMTRDSRIGEITNVSTSIENKYTTNSDVQKLYSDFSSLLRILQGKEIDFVKTGLRWQMNKGLRKHLKQLPYFLLFKYPQKMKTYNKLREVNKTIESDSDKIKLNAYRSPSPMNELCDYICSWEKRKILWDNKVQNLIDTRCLIVNNDLDLTDKIINRTARRYINKFNDEVRKHLDLNKAKNGSSYFNIELLIQKFKSILLSELKIDEELIANYVINASYSTLSISKLFAWSAYGDYIIKNLSENSNPKKNISITEVPYQTNSSHEYLGKFYEFKEVSEYR